MRAPQQAAPEARVREAKEARGGKTRGRRRPLPSALGPGSGREQRFRQRPDRFGMGGRDVAGFLAVVRVVVKFDGAVAPAGEAPAVGAHGVAARRAPRDERESGGFARGGGILQERPEAPAGEIGRRREPAQVGEGRIKVHELNQPAGDTGPDAGRGDHERCAARALEERVLVPPGALAEVVAVVAEEHDDGVFPEPQRSSVASTRPTWASM